MVDVLVQRIVDHDHESMTIADKAAAKAVAHAIVAQANHRAGADRAIQGIEDHVEVVWTEFCETVARSTATATATAGVANATDIAAWTYAALSSEGGIEVGVDEIAQSVDERCFLGPAEPVWEKAHAALSSRDTAGGETELARAIVRTLEDRVDGDEQTTWLRDVATSTARQIARTWRPPHAPASARALRHDACTTAWILVLHRLLADTSTTDLARLAARSVWNRRGVVVDEEVENIKGYVVEHAPLVGRADAASIGRVAVNAPRFVERASSDAALGEWRPPGIENDDNADVGRDPVPEGGDPSGDEEDEEADGIDRGNAIDPSSRWDTSDAIYAGKSVELAHAALRRSVRSARRAMRVGPPNAAFADRVLRCITSYDYDAEKVFRLKLVYDRRARSGEEASSTEDANRPMTEADLPRIHVLVTRAYDQLRARVAEDGFVLLHDQGPDPKSEATKQVLDGLRLVLPHAERDRWSGLENHQLAEIGIGPTNLDAFDLELAGQPLLKVVRAFEAIVTSGQAARDDPRTAAVEELRRTRRAVRDALSVREPGVRFLREPQIEPKTRLPAGFGGPLLQAGRVVPITPGSALPIERKADELDFHDAVPRLPDPLNKTHVGRWWWVRKRGVGLVPREVSR